MRRALRYSIAPILLGFLAIPQADARGGGGGGGGGFHGGFGGFRGAPGITFHAGIRLHGNFARRSRFAGDQPRARAVAYGSGWSGGYAYPSEEPPPQPEVIVIHVDGEGRMTTAQAPADYSYVAGCHPIPNGYHCDAPPATP